MFMYNYIYIDGFIKKKMLIPNAISNTPTAAFASFQKFTCEFDELYYLFFCVTYELYYLVPPMCTSS